MRTGVAYNRCLQSLDYIFCCSRLRKKNYIEYIVFVRKYSGSRSKGAEKASIWILCIWFFIQFYYKDLHDLLLTPMYLVQILMLLFQRVSLFMVKVILFPLIFGLYMMWQCICHNRCRCKGHTDRQTMKL